MSGRGEGGGCDGVGQLTVVEVHDVVEVVDGQAAVGADVACDAVADGLVVETGFVAALAGDESGCRWGKNCI